MDLKKIKFEVRKYLKEKTDEILGNERNIKLLLIAVMLMLFMLVFRDYFVILFFIVVGSLSMVHGIWTRNMVGFELVTLGTVITAIYIGPGAAAVVGAVSIFFGLFLSINIDQYMPLSVIVFIVIAYVAAGFDPSSLLVAGIICAIIYDAVMLPLYYIMGANPVTTVSYFITHQISNYYVFKLIAPWLVRLFFKLV